MGLKTCRYCLQSIKIKGDYNTFYVCDQCYKQYKNSLFVNKNSTQPLIIKINKVIEQIDKEINKIRKNRLKKNIVDYEHLLEKTVILKKEALYIINDIDEEKDKGRKDNTIGGALSVFDKY